jgi:omega-6 fatty acid desaturase (delta-12 desaturase)
MCILSVVRSPSKHWDSVIALVFHFGIGALIFTFFGWQLFLIAFLLPALISSAMGSYLFYAQHNFPGATFKEKDGWSYVNAAMNSSSYMKLNPLMHWFTGNIGYHQKQETASMFPLRIPLCEGR